MRLQRPRVEPIPSEELDREIRERFGGGEVLGIFRTLAHHPDLMRRWMVFGNHILAKSTLDPRDRELAILRVGWLCRAGYEWGQHALIALEIGLSAEEIERVAEGSEAPGWSEAERLVLRATDELCHDSFIADVTWRGLGEVFSLQQRLDLIFTVGQYNLVSMALNSLGVQAEEGAPEMPSR
jgi:alkylhydroperoxidase family enzyme